jgi:archaellum component FlaC
MTTGFIISDVSEETTQNLANGDLRRIFERLDSIDSRLTSLEQKADARSYETKPIWEQALKEIAETRLEMRAGFEKMDARFEMLEQKLEILTDDVLTVRARHKNLDARVRNLESEPTQ